MKKLLRSFQTQLFDFHIPPGAVKHLFLERQFRKTFVHSRKTLQFKIFLNHKLLSNKYLSQSVIASGYQSMSVKQLLNMIAEILKIKENKISFSKKKLAGHYRSTPYSHSRDFDNKG